MAALLNSFWGCRIMAFLAKSNNPSNAICRKKFLGTKPENASRQLGFGRASGLCGSLATGLLHARHGPSAEAFLDQDFGSFIKALTALGLFAQTFVHGIDIARASAGAGAEIAFADGIADADVHPSAPKRVALFLMRMACSSA
jgi:hypothetical protein